jgi:hypothetical protein
MKHKATLDIYTDTIMVTWDGNVWLTSTGAQYAERDTAFRAELEAYLCACGDEECEADIDDMLSNVVEDSHGPKQ